MSNFLQRNSLTVGVSRRTEFSSDQRVTDVFIIMSLGLFVFSMDTGLVLRVACLFTSQISLLPAAYTGW